MNRSARAHRSTKIPNVKLRPAQAQSSSSSSASSSKQQQNRLARRRDELLDDREDAAHFRQLRDDGRDHGAHVDADFIGNSAHPLKGAIISITGLGDLKPTLTQYARELGARVEGNLTEDVTHLIADRPGSEKYRYALQLGMHIVSPNWLLAVREAWLQGEDVDAEQLEREHQLPALSNATICFAALTGSERRRLAALAKQLGATVSDEFRFDGTVTHLVSATADPNASSSVHHLLHFLDRSRHGRNGSREQAAARILAVRPEWLADCDKAAGCLSEQLYSIFAKLPDEKERESLIQQARTKLPCPFVREEKPVSVAFRSPFVGSSRNKLTLTESASDPHNDDVSQAQDEDEDDQPITLGSRQRAAVAAEKSFDSILSQLKGNQNTSTASAASSTKEAIPSLTAASSTTSAFVSSSPHPPAQPRASLNPQRTSLLGMSRASSFSPAPPPTATTTKSATLHMRKSAAKHVTLPHPSQASSTGDSAVANGGRGCFLEKSFMVCLKADDRRRTVEKVLIDNGATLLQPRQTASPDFAVVETRTSLADLKALDDAGVVPVLHYWIEYCLHHDIFAEPSAYFAALPAKVPLPLPEGGQLRLLLLGFDLDSPELYHAEKLIAEIGGRTVRQLKNESLTHVICASIESFEGKRAQRARSCGVPVVGLEFLINARQTGQITPAPIPVTVTDQSSSAITASGSSSSRTSSLSSMPHSSARLKPRTVSVTDMEETQAVLPLSGCTVSRSKPLTSQSVMLERKVIQLGACWQAQANDATTHLLHQGSGPPRENKDLSRDAFLVHPTWLDKCIEQGIRVDESLFPSSMNPIKSLMTVLSSSDGSASGNFLSQATQSTVQQKHKSQGTQQTQAELVAAAKPWHRSISADAAKHEDRDWTKTAHGLAQDRNARGRSEEIDMDNAGRDEEFGELTIPDGFDADITLSGDVPRHPGGEVDDAAVAPSSQTLFEGEEEADVPIPEVRSAKKVPDQPKQVNVAPTPPAAKSVTDQLSSADPVMELLRTRSLAQGARKKNRLPPRARKQRSDEGVRSSNEGMLPPEKVLEVQARLDAQRAAEAAAQGYSLGMDKDISQLQGSQNGQIFDSSIRIVYDDPAARKERHRLLKMLDHQKHEHGSEEGIDPVQEEAGADTEQSEGTYVESVEGAAGANGAKKRPAEDTFGAGRQSRHYWENRNSESPTKRPVVRRQPLARR